MLFTSAKQTLSRAFCLSAALLLLGISNSAWALFSDDEARKAILDLRKTLATTQLELQGQIEKLKADNAELRGKIEGLEKQSEEINSSQKTYYQDLDNRLGNFEPRTATIEGVSGIVQPNEKKAYDMLSKPFSLEASKRQMRALLLLSRSILRARTHLSHSTGVVIVNMLTKPMLEQSLSFKASSKIIQITHAFLRQWSL